MSNVKISQLPPLSASVENTDVIPIVDGGQTKKVTALTLQAYTQGNSVLLTGNQSIDGVKTFIQQLVSSVATGTAPFQVASTTKVTNLNADYLDGYTSADLQLKLNGTGIVKSTSGTISYLTDNSSNWNTAYNDTIVSAAVTGTTIKTLTLTQQDGGTISAYWDNTSSDLVTSVFGRIGDVVAQSGDYTTTQVTEGTNLYFTDARSRNAFSNTATGLTYTSGTGVLSTTAGYGIPTLASQSSWDAKQPAGDYITALTGEASASGPGSASVTLLNSAVIGKVLTGLNVTGGSISASDSILSAFGKVQNQINGLVGGVIYKGTWNASTNTPTLASSVGTQGNYYIVSVAGSTDLNGITDWKVGDWAIYDGSAWQKVDNTDSVTSVNGLTGAVSLTTSNISEGTNLYFTDARVNANANVSSAYNDTITSAEVTGTSTKTLTLTQRDLGTITASWSDIDTGLTSVGLSMPSAFSVSNSPLTSNGTIAVTGAGTGAQYIKGDGTLATFPSTIANAQRLITEVYNETGATLIKGTVVYINGGHGNLPTITKAIATGDATSAQTYGIVENDITNNNNGYVVVSGALSDVNTNDYVVGTALYLSSTIAGAWTSTKQYAPAHLVYLGVVTRQHPTQGIVEVKIQNGYEMDELHNVAAQSPSNGDILQYVSATSLWTKTAGTTSNITEGSNLYYTDARARSAFSESVTGLDYNSTTGVLSTTSGYGIPTTASQTTWDTAYNDSIVSAAVTGTATKTLTLNQQDGGTITASWNDYDTAPVTSVFGRTGAVVAASGDYTTTQVTEGTNLYYTDARFNTSFAAKSTTFLTEGTNLYYTDARARGAISLTTSGTSGAATYTSGVLNIPQYQAALTNPVTGTGTTNYLPKFTGTSALGNSLVYDNGTNIGIGTTSPIAPLTINGSVAITNGSGYFNNIYYSGGWKYIGNGYAWATFIDGTAGDYVFYSAGNNTSGANASASPTERIRFTNTGSLLVNTTTDAGYKLDVNGTARVQGAATFSSSVTTGGNLGVGITPSTATGFRYIQFGAGAALSTNNTNNSNFYHNTTFDASGNTLYAVTGQQSSFYRQINGLHVWATAPSGTAGNAITFTQNMVLDASGRLGIGTTSPSEKLDIYSNDNSQQGLKITNPSSGGNAITVTKYSNGTYTHLFGALGTNYTGYGALQANEAFIYSSNQNLTLTADGVSASIKFGTGAGVTERMRITPAGNVGIGVTSGFNSISGTETTLHIANSNVASIYLNSTGAKKWGIYSSGAGRLHFENLTDAINSLTINPNGNVLIGTTTDNGAKLQVNGAISIGNTVSTAVSVMSTHKVQIVINGTTYYLLATT